MQWTTLQLITSLRHQSVLMTDAGDHYVIQRIHWIGYQCGGMSDENDPSFPSSPGSCCNKKKLHRTNSHLLAKLSSSLPSTTWARISRRSSTLHPLQPPLPLPNNRINQFNRQRRHHHDNISTAASIHLLFHHFLINIKLTATGSSKANAVAFLLCRLQLIRCPLCDLYGLNGALPSSLGLKQLIRWNEKLSNIDFPLFDFFKELDVVVGWYDETA